MFGQCAAPSNVCASSHPFDSRLPVAVARSVARGYKCSAAVRVAKRHVQFAAGRCPVKLAAQHCARACARQCCCLARLYEAVYCSFGCVCRVCHVDSREHAVVVSQVNTQNILEIGKIQFLIIVELADSTSSHTAK